MAYFEPRDTRKKPNYIHEMKYFSTALAISIGCIGLNGCFPNDDDSGGGKAVFSTCSDYSCDSAAVAAIVKLNSSFNRSAVPKNLTGRIDSLILSYIDTIPPEIGKLSELRIMQINGRDSLHGLRSFPPEIGRLTRLEILIIDGCQIQTLPREFGNLKALRGLYLRTPIIFFPEEFGSLENITNITLTQGRVSEIPALFGRLKNLASLIIIESPVRKISPELVGLKNLTTLRLSATELDSLPTDIGNMKNLVTLSVDHSRLTTLPKSIGRMDSIKTMRFENNNISSIPSEISSMKGVDYIALNYNILDSIPTELSNLNLNVFNVNNNKLCAVSPSISDWITRSNHGSSSWKETQDCK